MLLKYTIHGWSVSVFAPVAEQLSLLMRGVDKVEPEHELREKLERSYATQTPLRVKYGIDPTGIDVHLGHTVPLRKLRQFQNLGHTAVIIIGNYTALVGDPSGRDETRASLTESQVESNARDYLFQVGKIIDLDRAEVHRNGDWFGKFTFLQVLDLCRRMTIGQMTARDDFAKRIASEKPVYLHECLYPLMQGWDSVEIRADIELGGTEQLFSLLVARDLQRAQEQSPQVAMTLPILVGTDGVRRMGKSLGNYVGVADPPETMFGKIMSIPDAPLRQYFTLLTEQPGAEIDRLLEATVNPRETKDALARDVVAQYYGAEAAAAASEAFRQRAKGTFDFELIESIVIPGSDLDADGCILPGKLLHAAGFVRSATEGSNKVNEGAVWLGEGRQPLPTDRKIPLKVVNGMIIGMGKGNKTRAKRVELAD
jgi:tyrosyl-tRNA synthetase